MSKELEHQYQEFREAFYRIQDEISKTHCRAREDCRRRANLPDDGRARAFGGCPRLGQDSAHSDIS